MDINKILALLDTTSEGKLKTAKREFAPVRVSAKESANDILNRELGIAKEFERAPVTKLPKEEPHKEVTESIIEAPNGAFPEELEFDEEKFGEEYGIEIDTIVASYVPESEDKREAEHIDVSFEFEGQKVLLAIYSDGEVRETVDGTFVEPAQFIGKFEKEEQEDGTMKDVLIIELLDESEEEAVKSEGDELTKSEGDEKHFDEDGGKVTDEFIEEAGLDNDEFYAKGHDLQVVKNPANRIDPKLGTIRANESLAKRVVKGATNK